jgi:hypothetical protein
MRELKAKPNCPTSLHMCHFWEWFLRFGKNGKYKKVLECLKNVSFLNKIRNFGFRREKNVKEAKI